MPTVRSRPPRSRLESMVRRPTRPYLRAMACRVAFDPASSRIRAVAWCGFPARRPRMSQVATVTVGLRLIRRTLPVLLPDQTASAPSSGTIQTGVATAVPSRRYVVSNAYFEPASSSVGVMGAEYGYRANPVTGVSGDYRVGMSGAPRVGDAFGDALRAALAELTGVGLRPTVVGRIPRPVVDIVERDDGFINGVPTARYLAGPDAWWPCDRRAVARIEGSTLDIGAGAGRTALVLQERGVPVTALDTSPGAVAVARARGVRQVVRSTVDDHARAGRSYDTFALFGNNVGLLESRERAPGFLAALAALARPGARLVAQGTDPYRTVDPLHLAYHERNRRLDRLGGQVRLRVRYLDVATPWFDYLLCSVDELAGLTAGTGWKLSDVDDADAPVYVATLAYRP